ALVDLGGGDGERCHKEGVQVPQLSWRDHEVLNRRHRMPIPTPHFTSDGEREVACLPGFAHLSPLREEQGVKLCQFLLRGDLFKGCLELRLVFTLNLVVDQVALLRAWKLPEQFSSPRLEKYGLVQKLDRTGFRNLELRHGNVRVSQGFDSVDH